MDEIKATLEKHDLCAVIILGSPTHSEFLYRLDAKWTCMTHEQLADAVGLRFKALAVDYPSKAVQKSVVETSCGTLISFCDLARDAASNLGLLVDALKRKFKITHTSTRDG